MSSRLVCSVHGSRPQTSTQIRSQKTGQNRQHWKCLATLESETPFSVAMVAFGNPIAHTWVSGQTWIHRKRVGRVGRVGRPCWAWVSGGDGFRAEWGEWGD